MSVPMETLNALLELISESEEYELEKECALRGIKYKKKQKLKRIEPDQNLDDAVQRMIKNGR